MQAQRSTTELSCCSPQVQFKGKYVNRCIRVFGFLPLKRGFRRIFSFLLKSMFLQTMYLSCVWKWIRSREQNSAPESWRASSHNVKVIKMSRLTIDCFLILWSLHGSLRCCKTDRETDCTTFLYLDAQEVQREDNSGAPKTAPETLAFFNCAYLCSRLKFFGMRLTKSTRI